MGVPGLGGKPVLLDPSRADAGQRRVPSRSVAPEQPRNGFIPGLAPRAQALSVLPPLLQRPEQGFAAAVARRLIDAVMPYSVRMALTFWRAHFPCFSSVTHNPPGRPPGPMKASTTLPRTVETLFLKPFTGRAWPTAMDPPQKTAPSFVAPHYVISPPIP